METHKHNQTKTKQKHIILTKKKRIKKNIFSLIYLIININGESYYLFILKNNNKRLSEYKLDRERSLLYFYNLNSFFFFFIFLLLFVSAMKIEEEEEKKSN